jgi:hypothetical protein
MFSVPIDFSDLAQIGPRDPTAGLDGGYYLEIPRIESKIGVIRVTQLEAFGNGLLQINAAINVAITLDINHIILQRNYATPDTHPVPENDPLWYLETGTKEYLPGKFIHNYHRYDNFAPADLLTLSGTFAEIAWSLGQRPKVCEIKNYFLDGFRLLRPFMNFKSPDEELHADDLVIYLRSGNVFQGLTPTGYGQPPLIFYTSVIALAKWRRVFLVFENYANPVIQELINYCKIANLDLKICQLDLRRTIELMLQAKNLVLARGSFSPSIAHLSSELVTVFDFCQQSMFFLQSPRFRYIEGFDISMEYVRATSHWVNSPQQRELMTSYSGTIFFNEMVRGQVGAHI